MPHGACGRLSCSDEFGATEPKAQMLRFHTQTGGSTLTAQQPDNNVVRTAYQALAAVLGGTQSLHTNALDEALGLPTESSARTALRTQQILAYETGVPEAVDPLAGSYYVEHLTDELENEAKQLMNQVEDLGGSVRAIEAGFIQEEIEEAAFCFQKEVESEERVIVGVNRFRLEQETPVPVQELDADTQTMREQQIQAFRENRNQEKTDDALSSLCHAARGEDNLFPHVLDAFREKATLGEICGVLRREWGEYQG